VCSLWILQTNGRVVSATESAARKRIVKTTSVAAFSTILVTCGALALIGYTSQPHDHEIQAGRAVYNPVSASRVLNELRDDINGRYGFREGAPRVNLGPCGRFARDFRERWNACFREPVIIAFLMSGRDPSNCYHVLVKLPDGRYFDGGNGVVTEQFLRTQYSDLKIEEMKEFDFSLLDKRSYGLGRNYLECPNYSDEFTRQTIEKRLSGLITDGPR